MRERRTGGERARLAIVLRRREVLGDRRRRELHARAAGEHAAVRQERRGVERAHPGTSLTPVVVKTPRPTDRRSRPSRRDRRRDQRAAVGSDVPLGPKRVFVSAGPARNVFVPAWKSWSCRPRRGSPRSRPTDCCAAAIKAPPPGSGAAAWKERIFAMLPTAAVADAAGVTAAAEHVASTSRRRT